MTFALFAGVFICAPRTEALTEQQIREEIKDIQAEQAELQEKINKIKEDKAKQEELKEASEKQMALVQQEIDACNQQINSINAKIEANQAEIDQKNKEIEENELAFKKRLRAIYMSNSDSNVRILLGAEDFSQFLELSQLTASVSAHDKLLIENIVAAIDVLNEKQEENNKLLQDQMAVKETITAKQDELKSQSNQIQSIISSLESQQGKNEAEQADNAALFDVAIHQQAPFSIITAQVFEEVLVVNADCAFLHIYRIDPNRLVEVLYLVSMRIEYAVRTD